MLVDNIVIQGSHAGGPFISDRLNISAERHYISIVYFTDSTFSTVANPTSGSADIDASETGEQYGQVATINAADSGENSSYDRPLISGNITNVRVGFTGIVGATHFRLTIAGYDNQ